MLRSRHHQFRRQRGSASSSLSSPPPPPPTKSCLCKLVLAKQDLFLAFLLKFWHLIKSYSQTVGKLLLWPTLLLFQLISATSSFDPVPQPPSTDLHSQLLACDSSSSTYNQQDELSFLRLDLI